MNKGTYIGVARKHEVDGLIFRDQDPAEYTHICPRCQSRWGEGNPRREITLVYCPECPKPVAKKFAKWNNTYECSYTLWYE